MALVVMLILTLLWGAMPAQAQAQSLGLGVFAGSALGAYGPSAGVEGELKAQSAWLLLSWDPLSPFGTLVCAGLSSEWLAACGGYAPGIAQPVLLLRVRLAQGAWVPSLSIQGWTGPRPAAMVRGALSLYIDVPPASQGHAIGNPTALEASNGKNRYQKGAP